eukprot:Mycagemm_TRINITY_DN9699_c0_g1::TRINITY_DN9699_c0_g1_i1::g.2486::m.2486 type:complete len:111 gc:universal TRINITY_DN9699_c0_g1_i1:240-572(+)
MSRTMLRSPWSTIGQPRSPRTFILVAALDRVADASVDSSGGSRMIVRTRARAVRVNRAAATSAALLRAVGADSHQAGECSIATRASKTSAKPPSMCARTGSTWRTSTFRF